jgi:hypothetical protein
MGENLMLINSTYEGSCNATLHKLTRRSFHTGSHIARVLDETPDLVCVLDLAQVGDQRVGVAADVHNRGEVFQQLHCLIVEAGPVGQWHEMSAVCRRSSILALLI